jgi:hypothetical protein
MFTQAIGLLAAASCTSLSLDDVGTGELKGRVLVEWVEEDRFVYRKTDRPVSFKPSFLSIAIIPEDMYTDGGSVPRVFWSVPGLSPWGLGPAYIMHDWIFEVHRCGRDAPPEVQNLTFEQSAQILAEVGRALVDAGLIQNNMLPQVVWAIRTRYARDIWERPAGPDECSPPPRPVRGARSQRTGNTVVDFTIPPPRLH